VVPVVDELRVIDDAIQALGAAGVTTDTDLSKSYPHQRTVRLADGRTRCTTAPSRMQFGRYNVQQVQ